MYKQIKVNEIDNKFVGVDCAQLMIPFDKALSIFSEKELTFYGRGYPENKIDNTHYIQDERKKQFPYNETPYHCIRKIFSTKIYVNQLFDFNKPYVLINNGILSEYYVTKEDDKTYIIQTYLAVDDKDDIVKKYIEKEKVYDFFGEMINKNDGKKTYIVDSTGKHLNICFDENERKQKRNELIEILKQKEILDSFDEHNIWYRNGDFILEDNFLLPFNKTLFMVKLDDNEMKVKLIQLSSLNEDIVTIMSFDIPVEIYTLEQISEIVKDSAKKLKEPVFSKTLGKNKFIRNL